MSLIEQCKGEKIRTRNISVAIYTLDEESIAVEGVLKDDRFVTQYTFVGDEFRRVSFTTWSSGCGLEASL